MVQVLLNLPDGRGQVQLPVSLPSALQAKLEHSRLVELALLYDTLYEKTLEETRASVVSKHG